ncbi:MAG: hypothetical protein VYA34_06900 [Myxococcota bacterium]|nr:hypothetical protein [Myxococcota bacterium]
MQLFTLALLTSSLLGAVDPETDLTLVPGSVALEEPRRYESPRNYDDTLKYMRAVTTKTRTKLRRIVNRPGLRAHHIASRDPKTKWEGVNIYQWKGHIRYFILLRQDTPKK